MVDLIKTAKVSLEKAGASGDEKVAVYLVLDHSGSMEMFYSDGDVQRLAEQALGLSANLDDDGIVPTVLFHDDVYEPFDVDINAYAGVVERQHRKASWGGTRYAPAMQKVRDLHRASNAGVPGFVIFQTDGAPGDRGATEQLLRDCSEQDELFFAFVGFGNDVGYLGTLSNLPGRAIDNASAFHAKIPRQVSDEQLYDGLTHELIPWLRLIKQRVR
jgi:hypothetical protein